MCRIVKISVICLSVAMFGCKGLNPFATGDRVLASVNDTELLESDMKGVCAGVTGDDSVILAEAYVDSWVKKQLKIQTAEVLFSDSEGDIERLVEEYRNSLLNNKIDQYYVEKYLDTIFTEENVSDYYNNRINDFMLDRDILKGRIAIVPEGYRQRGKLKDLMESDNDERRQDFADICQKNSFRVIEFNTWTDFSEFLSHLPLSKGDDYDELLSKRSVQELTSGDDKYLFQITNVRRKGDLMPLERVNESIRRILYNQRKTELLKMYEDSLYRSAEKEGALHIYKNKNK